MATAFRPNLRVKQDAQTVPQGPRDVSTEADVHRDYRRSGQMGHSASIQTTSRLPHDVLVKRDDGEHPSRRSIRLWILAGVGGRQHCGLALRSHQSGVRRKPADRVQ